MFLFCIKAIKKGIAYLSENRKEDGLFLQLNIMVNLTVSVINKISNIIGIVNHNKQVNNTNELIERFSIVSPNIKSKCPSAVLNNSIFVYNKERMYASIVFSYATL